MIRDAYEQAATLFVETVTQVGAAQWNLVALGEWTVRDLVGHANRALLTVETYLDNPSETVDVARPADYFLRASALLADPAAVAARGREAGQALGDDPPATVEETATRVLARVQQTPDDTCLTTPVGGMRLIDYLPSRVFELTIHTLDLGTAISADIDLPEAASALTLGMITELAQQRGKAAPLLLAATGRRALPSAFSVL
ncbi:MAG: maleylpyruvate isomerase N-terminal domain-containing protein [Candidatus Tectomicrobia bacterium]|nr:maleylpyruvate isomerase N-terminal domain-containing protein [Candidatus Tectomicrobia bacterium]